jgi:4-alpha-glucanotransferase
MREQDFAWWVERMNTELELFDALRIDHFRGLEASWEIPAEHATAEHGQWRAVPGRELLIALRNRFGRLPLIAEDLGFITPGVDRLRRALRLPGMKVLQFAFDGGAGNPYLPHNHEPSFVVYTGTHDNNTTVGWFESLDPAARDRVYEYLGRPSEPMPWPLIIAALASVCRLAIIPMQDLLALGAEHRTNTPGTIEGNWRWRLNREHVTPELTARLRHLNALYGRV